MLDTRTLTPTHFVWSHKGLLTTGLYAAPAVMEAGVLAYALVKDPKAVKKKIQNATQYFCSSFRPKEGETPEDFKKRLIKNVLLVGGMATLATATIIGSACLLPSAIAISVAISTLVMLGDLFLNAEQYAEKLSKVVSDIRKFNTEGKKYLFYGCCAMLILAATITFLALAAIRTATGSISIWTTYNLLPFQSPLGVTLEYLGVGVAHGALGIKYAKEKKWGNAFFHFGNSIYGCMTPALLMGFPAPMRLHHSIIGLLISLIPYRPAKLIGSAISADALGNLFFKQQSLPFNREFDFMNIVVGMKNPGSLQGTIGQYVGTSAIGHLADSIHKSSTGKATLAVPQAKLTEKLAAAG